MKHSTIGIESRDLAAIIVLTVLNVMDKAGVCSSQDCPGTGKSGWIQSSLGGHEGPTSVN